MKKLFLFPIICLFIQSAGFSADFNSLKVVGDAAYERGSQVVIDNAGNKYLAGITAGTIVLGSETLINTSFIAKFDASNSVLWVKRFYTTGYGASKPYSMKLDNQENIVVQGFMPRDSALIVGDSVNTTQGTGYVFKLNKDGQVQWTKRLYWNSQQYSSYQDMAIDASNNIFITGKFRNSTDSKSKIGLSKISPTGTVLFLNQLDKFIAYGMDVTSSNDLIITGQSDTNVANLSGVYITRVNNSGSQIWKRNYGKNCRGDKVFVNQKTGSVFISGRMNGDSIDFGNGNKVYKTLAGEGAFIIKIDASNGDVIWANAINTDSKIGYEDQSTGNPAELKNSRIHVAVDSIDQVYVGANFTNQVVFTPSDNFTVTTSSRPSLFLSIYNAAGVFQSAKKWGNEGQYNYLTDMEIDSKGQLHFTGYFSDAQYNNFVAGTYSVKGVDASDIFLASYGEVVTSTQTVAGSPAMGYTLFPNPVVNGNVKISGGAVTQFTVVNVLGQVVLSGNSNHFSVSSLSSGVYFVNINGKQSLRLVKP